MKLTKLIPFLGIAILFQCTSPKPKTIDFSSVSQVETGNPVSVMLTSYSTTLIANGKDQTKIRIALTDSIGREIKTATDSIQILFSGDGILTDPNGVEINLQPDKMDFKITSQKLVNGTCNLLLTAGNKPGSTKIQVRSGDLRPGDCEIHMLPKNFELMTPTADQLPATTKPTDKIIGADISFLPQIEARNYKFFENNQEIDALKLLKDHGFNYIRLRIFVNPEDERGYSPQQGFCGLKPTLEMAKRINNAGLKLLLDFHYSDNWADPQKQIKPLAWDRLDFETLKDSVKTYTTRVLTAFKNQGTMPAMVQIGNEVNHGILWPEGHISHPDQLADLLKAGVEGVESVNNEIPVMMHIALGGQHDESVFWLNNMIARGVRFDIIGISYYTRWHGTLNDLQSNLTDLVTRFNKPVNVVEYGDFKREVHDIVFNLPDEMGKGACIWEPLSARSGLFDRQGNTTTQILLYDEIHSKYLTKQD
ncbi:MAG: glycosyl hydrolase 53 family protein [Prolixibacteraceae bacterium]